MKQLDQQNMDRQELAYYLNECSTLKHRILSTLLNLKQLALNQRLSPVKERLNINIEQEGAVDITGVVSQEVEHLGRLTEAVEDAYGVVEDRLL